MAKAKRFIDNHKGQSGIILLLVARSSVDELNRT